MQNWLLIESRADFGAADSSFFAQLACSLAAAGHAVNLLLAQNGVLPARAGAQAPALAKLLAAGVLVLADDFSLAERGIAAPDLKRGVRGTSLDLVVDRLLDGWKVLWH